MNLEMSASNNDEDFVKELLIDIEENLEPEASSNCCIYRVPKKIRKMNDEAYTPQVISIGPLHYGKEELVVMEKQKRRYMKSFLQRITAETQNKIFTFIQNNEQVIRNCYAEKSELGSLEFLRMIIYDSIFVIELFIRTSYLFLYKSDILLSIPALRYGIYMDLELLENQLPYFVPEEIHNLAIPDLNMPTFEVLSCSFFGSFRIYNILPLLLEVKHFTDWKRSALLESYPISVTSRGSIKDLPCAVKLHESGVKFKGVESECLLSIKFEKRKRRFPCFNADELQIPCLEVFSSTERLFRNIIAFEQCHYPYDTLFCHYIQFLDCLIDTEKDVDLLIEQGIICNHLGDSASLANMFNKLYQYVHLSKSSYYETCEELKKHYNNPWHRKKATLKRVYFNNLWRGTATVAAVILLLLTVIQTTCYYLASLVIYTTATCTVILSSCKFKMVLLQMIKSNLF